VITIIEFFQQNVSGFTLAWPPCISGLNGGWAQRCSNQKVEKVLDIQYNMVYIQTRTAQPD